MHKWGTCMIQLPTSSRPKQFPHFPSLTLPVYKSYDYKALFALYWFSIGFITQLATIQ